jgi:hypothetical protein
MKPFQFEGTVSHGTLQSNHLISAFVAVVEQLLTDRATDAANEVEAAASIRAQLDLVAKLQPEAIDDEAGLDAVDYLLGALNYLAPAGYYFGAHPGDGSDFGFWKNEEP